MKIAGFLFLFIFSTCGFSADFSKLLEAAQDEVKSQEKIQLSTPKNDCEPISPGTEKGLLDLLRNENGVSQSDKNYLTLNDIGAKLAKPECALQIISDSYGHKIEMGPNCYSSAIMGNDFRELMKRFFSYKQADDGKKASYLVHLAKQMELIEDICIKSEEDDFQAAGADFIEKLKSFLSKVSSAIDYRLENRKPP